MLSKNKIRAFAAVLALAAGATAQAAFVFTDSPLGQSTHNVPTNNDFRGNAGLGTVQVSSFVLGRVLGLTDVGKNDVIDIEFFGAEAAYRNNFYFDGNLVLSNQGNVSFGAHYLTSVAAYEGTLDFLFCAVTVNKCLSNAGNDNKGWNSEQSIGMRLSDDRSMAWLLWDDSGANRDDDHDDLIIRLRHRRVPEPGTLALFGAGLIGFALLRRRRAVFGNANA